METRLQLYDVLRIDPEGNEKSRPSYLRAAAFGKRRTKRKTGIIAETLNHRVL
jgi:hypothetical protein